MLLSALGLTGPALTAVQLGGIGTVTLVSQISSLILGPDAPASVIGLHDFGIRLHGETNSADGVSRSPLFAFQSRAPDVASTETPPPGITSPHEGTIVGDVANLTYGLSTLAASCKLTAMAVATPDPDRLYALTDIGAGLHALAVDPDHVDLPAPTRTAVFADPGQSEDGALALPSRTDVPVHLGDGDQVAIHHFQQGAHARIVTISADGSIDGALMTNLFRPTPSALTDRFEYVDGYRWRHAIDADGRDDPRAREMDERRTEDQLAAAARKMTPEALSPIDRARHYLDKLRRRFETYG